MGLWGCLESAPLTLLVTSLDIGVHSRDARSGQIDGHRASDFTVYSPDVSVQTPDVFVSQIQDQGSQDAASRPDARVEPDAAISVGCDNSNQENEECETGLLGDCRTGQMRCVGTSWVCEQGHIADAEACTGRDNDCDGKTDEGPVCGQWAEENCRVWWGWRRKFGREIVPRDNWQTCLDEGEVLDGDQRCTSTRGDGRFVHLSIRGDVGKNMGGDQFALAFTCENDPQGRGQWIQANCEVFLGRMNDRGDLMAAPVDEWGPCPEGMGAHPMEPDIACVSSSKDGEFHPLPISGEGRMQERDMNENDALSIAFRCADDQQADRSSGMTSALDVFIGVSESLETAMSDGYTPNEGAAWNRCPEIPRDNMGNTRCVSSGGTGQFFWIGMNSDVKDDDIFGLALRARPLAD
jgi:hypothetical protein